MNLRQPSLRKRLLVLLLSGTLAFWVIVAAVSYVNTHHEVDELMDAQLLQVGHTVLAVALADFDNDLKPASHWHYPTGIASRYTLEDQSKIMFQLWDGKGKLLLRSPNAPSDLPVRQTGFSEFNDKAGHWRYFSVRDDGGKYEVVVGQDHAIRDELVVETIFQLLWPMLVGTPLLGLWVWLATGAALRPLVQIRKELDHRGANHLDKLGAKAIPEEIAPLVSAINRLLGKIESGMEQERRFTSDAAHELRTPLAALKAQLHVLNNARSDAERGHALGQMDEGLTNASRLVGQMLRLARLDAAQELQPNQFETLDLANLAQEVCAAQGLAALEKFQELSLNAEKPVLVSCVPEWLQILVRNLVDNAIRYTPENGVVQVVVETDGAGCAHLHVADSGPGIPPEKREAALSRFHRLGHDGESGHGLGLSIVQRIAELHGAQLGLGQDASLGGLRVSVSFPSPGVRPNQSREGLDRP